MIAIFLAVILTQPPAPAAIKLQPTEADAVAWAFTALASYPDTIRPTIRFVWLPPWATLEWHGALDFAVNASRATTQQQAAAEQPQPGETTPSAPLIAKYCGACHGPQLASPRGSLYLDTRPQSVRVIAEELGMIRDRLLSDMPPADSPQPTQAERQAMLAELTALTRGTK